MITEHITNVLDWTERWRPFWLSGDMAAIKKSQGVRWNSGAKKIFLKKSRRKTCTALGMAVMEAFLDKRDEEGEKIAFFATSVLFNEPGLDRVEHALLFMRAALGVLLSEGPARERDGEWAFMKLDETIRRICTQMVGVDGENETLFSRLSPSEAEERHRDGNTMSAKGVLAWSAWCGARGEIMAWMGRGHFDFLQRIEMVDLGDLDENYYGECKVYEQLSADGWINSFFGYAGHERVILSERLPWQTEAGHVPLGEKEIISLRYKYINHQRAEREHMIRETNHLLFACAKHESSAPWWPGFLLTWMHLGLSPSWSSVPGGLHENGEILWPLPQTRKEAETWVEGIKVPFETAAGALRFSGFLKPHLDGQGAYARPDKAAAGEGWKETLDTWCKTWVAQHAGCDIGEWFGGGFLEAGRMGNLNVLGDYPAFDDHWDEHTVEDVRLAEMAQYGKSPISSQKKKSGTSRAYLDSHDIIEAAERGLYIFEITTDGFLSAALGNQKPENSHHHEVPEKLKALVANPSKSFSFIEACLGFLARHGDENLPGFKERSGRACLLLEMIRETNAAVSHEQHASVSRTSLSKRIF